jgi:hypothetical protein
VNKGKYFLSLFFLAITLTGSLKIAGTLGYYAMFTDDFVERFCENKEKPELQCDGKCYLAKMLLQESKDDNPPINIELLKNETVLFLEKNITFDFFGNQKSDSANYAYSNHYYFNFLQEEIRPPRA